jgi:NCS1 family nucleobase:cation symporter-1
VTNASRPSSLVVETHSIEFVPLSERYGEPGRLFTIWFSINLSIVCAAVGTLGIIGGLSLSWTVLAIVIGNGIGTVFMAAHSAQGPHLGVPQMIQSRAQFGVLGAALPLLAVVITYILYTAADGLIVEKTLGSLLGVSNDAALLIFGGITLIVAYIGYELIHRVAAVLSVLSAILFATVTFKYLLHGVSGPVQPLTHPSFRGEVFMATVTQAAAWTLSFGPYVADYSRYLLPSVKTSRTFWYTATGCFLGAVLTMSFGAYLATVDSRFGGDLGGAVAGAFPRGRRIAQAVIVLGVLVGNVMNLYSAYMSTATIFAGIVRMRSLDKSTKLLTMSVVIALATGIAWWAQGHFDQYFADMLGVMVYMLVPWSAINLADYYLVRKGTYVIEELYLVNGMYGTFRFWTILTYAIGILFEVPFMDLSTFKGPIARVINMDVAWAVGLVVSGVLYVLVEKWQMARLNHGAGATPAGDVTSQ